MARKTVFTQKGTTYPTPATHKEALAQIVAILRENTSWKAAYNALCLYTKQQKDACCTIPDCGEPIADLCRDILQSIPDIRKKLTPGEAADIIEDAKACPEISEVTGLEQLALANNMSPEVMEQALDMLGFEIE